MKHLSEQTRQRIRHPGYTIFQKIRYVYSEYAYLKLLDSRWKIAELLSEIIDQGEKSATVVYSPITQNKLDQILPKLFTCESDHDWFLYQLWLRTTLRLMSSPQFHFSPTARGEKTPMEYVFQSYAMRTSS